MELPPPSYLDGVFPDGVADWTKFTAGTLTRLFHATATFAHAWTPLERRWESGGALPVARATGTRVVAEELPPPADFSRMQPTEPNPWAAAMMVVSKMLSAAGAKEAELQGSSSVMRGNTMTDVMENAT